MIYLKTTNKINNQIEYNDTDLKNAEIHPVNTSNNIQNNRN